MARGTRTVLLLLSNEFTSMDAPRGTRKWLFYTFLGMIADELDVILTYVMPDKTPRRSMVVSKLFFAHPVGFVC
jgi:hypothetical protein